MSFKKNTGCSKNSFPAKNAGNNKLVLGLDRDSLPSFAHCLLPIVLVALAAFAAPVLAEKRYTLENAAIRVEFDDMGRLVDLLNKQTVASCLSAPHEGRAARPVPFIIDAYSANQSIYIRDPMEAQGGGFSSAKPELLIAVDTWDVAQGTPDGKTTTRPTMPAKREKDADLYHLTGSVDLPPTVEQANKDGAQTLSFTYQLPADITVSFSVSLSGDENVTRWKIRVENGLAAIPWDQLRVYRVAFPVLGNLSVGGLPARNYLARPFAQGELIPDPSADCFARPNRWKTPTNVLTYPGWASMPWMDLYIVPPGDGGKASGLYFASYDPSCQQVDLEAIPNPQGRTMTLDMRTYAQLEPQNKWESQTFLVALHNGDWHWAADRYRQDSAAWFIQRDIPEWMKDCDGWLGSGGPGYKFTELPKMLEDARWLGLNYIQCWSEMIENVGPNKSRKAYYCFFLPDPARGGEAGAVEGIHKVRAMGGHIGFYSNFWTWDAALPTGLEQWQDQIPKDVPLPDWNREFKKYASVFPDGHLDAGDYTHGYAGMCPGAKGWRDYLKFWIVDKWVKQYGCDSWYLDSFPVTMFGASRVCFSPHNGAAQPHGVGRGLLEFVKLLRASAAPLKLAITSETVNDIFMQYNSHALGIEMVGGLSTHPRPEIYTYTFPHHAIFSGTCNNQLGLTYYYPDEKTFGREWSWHRVFLMGYRFDILAWPLDKNNAQMKYLQSVIALRKKIGPDLYNSSFRDMDGLGALPEKVEAKVFRHDAGKSLTITMIDRREKKDAFTLTIAASVFGLKRLTKAALHTVDGQSAEVAVRTLATGTLELTIPTHEGIPAAVIVGK